MRNHICFSLLLLLPACKLQTQESNSTKIAGTTQKTRYQRIGEIPIPAGFSRLTVADGSFGEWLRTVGLKKDNRVYLYNGSLKANQAVQFAVLDMPIGNKDLQQCADAVMRLRAEYFFSRKELDSIQFTATDGTGMSFSKWRVGGRYKLSGNNLQLIYMHSRIPDLQTDFENYLETVFSYAGTTSLAKELKPVKDSNDIQAGDVFVKPGFPGHAMIVVDVCINKEGEKMFMLAQGYMPAQDIHIVKNYENEKISPWYEIPVSGQLSTPQWIFNLDQLKRWR